MKRKRSDEYSQNSTPTIHPLQVDTAFDSVCMCIDELTIMQKKFYELPRARSLGEKEILTSKCNIVIWLEELFKETSVIVCQNPQTAAVLGNVSSYFPTTRLACNVISEILQMLYKMQCDISDMGTSLSKGESVEEQKHKVLCLKSDVVHRLELLFMGIKEKTGVESMDVESLDSEDYDDEDEDEMISSPVPRKNPVLNLDELRWSSMNEPNEKERYLCLSNGYEILCLDLSKFSSYPPKFPKVDTFSLLGSQLPASVGLFKLGSDAFMIGGQLLPGSLLDPSVTSHKRFSSLSNPKGLALYKSLLASHGIKRSSHVTYSLSLAADNKEDSTLSLSHTKTACFRPLNKPKFWPIVEKIGGKLHVMDSDPTYLTNGYRDRVFSHEVSGHDGGWREIPTIQGMDRIISHVVVGHRIYALTDEDPPLGEPPEVTLGDEREGCLHLVFDSHTEEWKGSTVYEYMRPSEEKRVREILVNGIVRCAVEFQHPRVDERLYVLIALARGSDSTPATAYLVKLTGEVVCYQRLPNFFSGGGSLEPLSLRRGFMFHTDEEEIGPARTMCSVLTSSIRHLSTLQEYLFINTFRVEAIKSEHVYSAVEGALSDILDGHAMELEFITFAPKNWYIYTLELNMLSCHFVDSEYVGWQACFLAPPP